MARKPVRLVSFYVRLIEDVVVSEFWNLVALHFADEVVAMFSAERIGMVN